MRVVRSFDPDGVTPRRHRCDVGDISYSRADEGFLECSKCGRTWELKVKRDKETGKAVHAAWIPYPCPGCNVPGPSCRHYGKKPVRRT